MPNWEFVVGDSVELAEDCNIDNGCLLKGAAGSVVSVADECALISIPPARFQIRECRCCFTFSLTLRVQERRR